MKHASPPPPLPAPEPNVAPNAGSLVPFRRACEDCAYFVEDRGVCAHEYPTAPHRRAAPKMEFCKEFELA